MDYALVVGASIYAVLALGSAVFLLAASVRPAVTNPLSWLLVVEGFSSFGVAQVVFELAPGSPAIQEACAYVIGFGFAAAPWLYVMFLGRALDVPLVRPWRSNRAQVLLFLGMWIHAFWFLFILDGPESYAGPLLVMVVPFVGALVYGLLAALQHLRRASGALARRQARVYVAAFLFRDVSQVVAVLGFILLPAVGAFHPGVIKYGVTLLYFGGPSMFVVLLLYGVLTGQVLGLDRGFRFGITQTTAVAIVAATFFIIVESIEQAFTIDSPALSVAVAGALFLLFRPIQRVSERFAIRLVPGDASHKDAGRAERLETYRGHLDLAWVDGPPNPAQRALLQRLREQVGLTVEDARAMEASARGR